MAQQILDVFPSALFKFNSTVHPARSDQCRVKGFRVVRGHDDHSLEFKIEKLLLVSTLYYSNHEIVAVFILNKVKRWF